MVAGRSQSIRVECADAGQIEDDDAEGPYRIGLGGAGGGPVQAFHFGRLPASYGRRQEHLASLRLPVAGMRVLEVGAGIGDHTHYFLDRGCAVTVTEAREENLALLRTRYPACTCSSSDLESPGTHVGIPLIRRGRPLRVVVSPEQSERGAVVPRPAHDQDLPAEDGGVVRRHGGDQLDRRAHYSPTEAGGVGHGLPADAALAVP